MNSMKRWGRVLAGGFASLFTTGIALAQQESTSTAVTSTSGVTQIWYEQWWIWAVGIAVFLIVIIALTSRGRARD